MISYNPTHRYALLLLPLLMIVAAGMAYATMQGLEIMGLLGFWAMLGAICLCRWPEWGIVFFISTFFLTYSEFLPATGRLTPNNLLGLLFVVLVFVKIFRERDLWFMQERSLQLYFLLTLLMMLSSLIADQRWGNPFPEFDETSQQLRMLVTRFAFLFFFVSFIRARRDIHLVLWTVLGFILLAAASSSTGQSGYRVQATMGISAAGNANWFAFYCTFGIAVIWYYRQAVRWRWLWLLLTAAVVGLAVTILLTASRSGLINLGLCFTLIAMQGRFSIARQLQTVLLAVVIGYLAVPLLTAEHLERLGNILPGSSATTKGSGSTESRIGNVMFGWQMIAQNPLFGIGIGNFSWVYLQNEGGGTGNTPHNSYLWATFSGGIPVLVCYLMLYAHIFRTFQRVEQQSHDATLRAMATGLRTGLLLFLFFSLFADFWLNILQYLIVGFAIVLKRVHDQNVLTYGSGLASRAPRRATRV